MKYSLSFIFIIVFLLFIHSCTDMEELDAVSPYDLLHTDLDTAYELALELRKKNENDNNLSGLVESNYLLGYIQGKREEYEKAVLHYLEAIHYGEKDSQKFTNNLISLYKNCGAIYWKTQYYSLAEEYHTKGIKLAETSGKIKQLVSLKYNLSILYNDQKEYDKSISLLQQALRISDAGSKKYFQILNSLGIRYREVEENELALSTFKNLIDELPLDQIKMRGYAFNNMAKTYWAMGDMENALVWYEKAIAEKIKLEAGNPSLLSSFYGIGEVYMMLGEFEKATDHFDKAERLLIGRTRLNPEYFELYNARLELCIRLEDKENALRYKRLYESAQAEQKKMQERMEKVAKNYDLEQLTAQFHQRLEEKQKASDRVLLISLGAASVLLSIALIVVVIRSRRKQQILYRENMEDIVHAINLLKKAGHFDKS